MSYQELNRLKASNEKLVKTNRKLNEMIRLMDRFRVLLIAMVNNCKCNTESNIRIKFNLLMEEYYDLNESKSASNGSQSSDQTIDDKSIAMNENNVITTQIVDNCHQIDVQSVVTGLLSDHSLAQTEDNTNCLDSFEDNLNPNELITTEMIGNIEEVTEEDDKRRESEKRRVYDSMTKTEDGRDLDLRERIARLKRYVARPKIYSRMNKPRVRTDQSFACSWPGCDSVFKAKVDMKTHLWRHTGEKIYACEWPGCDKRFPVKRNLARHRETHEGVKHYACDWPGCEYKSWYPQGVRAHRKRHTDERPHKCTWPHCEWTFRQSHHLKAHMLKHTGEKPFQCVWPGCDQRFQSRQAMKFHCDRAHHKT